MIKHQGSIGGYLTNNPKELALLLFFPESSIEHQVSNKVIETYRIISASIFLMENLLSAIPLYLFPYCKPPESPYPLLKRASYRSCFRCDNR
jgi:hypothetical protein